MWRKRFILTLLIIGVVYNQWILPRVRVANDLHIANTSNLLDWSNLPSSWNNFSIGEYSISTAWSWSLNFFVGLLGRTGLPHYLLVQIIGVGGALLLGIYGIYKLSNWFGVLFFLGNVFILVLIDGGQINLAMAYGILPLCYWLYKHKRIYEFTISVLLLSVFDIRIIYLLLILIFVDFFFNLKNFKSYLLNNFKIGIITGLVLTGFHAYWLIPSFFSRPPSLPAGYDNVSQISFLSFANWKHAFLLQQPHWPKNVFGQITRPNWHFLAIPAIALLGLIVSKKWHWGVVAILGIFLAKGNNPPFGEIYTWLFIHLPGFNLFRDPVKFYFLIAMSYAVLIGYAVEWLSKKFKFFPIIFSAYILFLTFPAWSGQMTGTFSKPRFEADYKKLGDYLSSDKRWGRVLWLSGIPPLGYVDTNNISLEGWKLSEMRPFMSGIVGSYETLNWIRDASYSAQLLKIAGVKYVSFNPLDPLRDSQKPEDIKYHDYFLNQLSETNWVNNKIDFGQVSLLETKENEDLFFVPEKIQFIVGGDDYYRSGINLSKNALVYTEEKPEIINRLNDFPNAQIVLHNKTDLDFKLASISKNKMIFPAKALKNSPDENGWWKREISDLIWWRNFLQEKYNLDNQDFDFTGGWAIAEGETRRSLINSKLIKGKNLYARVMISPKGGKIEFSQNNRFIGQIETHSNNSDKSILLYKGHKEIPDKFRVFDQGNFRWFDIGRLDENTTLEIRTFGGINVVNALVVSEKIELSKFNRHDDVDTNANVEVSYKKVNPTKYKITISGLKVPGMLVFAQAFDDMWELNGKKPVLVYSFLNGFPIERDGEYELVYLPQIYIYYGLPITFITVIGLIVVGGYSRIQAWRKRSEK